MTRGAATLRGPAPPELVAETGHVMQDRPLFLTGPLYRRVADENDPCGHGRAVPAELLRDWRSVASAPVRVTNQWFWSVARSGRAGQGCYQNP
jgi:hypothetical protein